MDENEINDANTTEAKDVNTSETTDAPKEKKEMPEKTRKIIGIVIMAIGAIISVTMSAFAGVIILLGGMWAYNPEVKEGGEKKVVPTWIGTLLIIAAVMLIAWLYKTFVM